MWNLLHEYERGNEVNKLSISSISNLCDLYEDQFELTIEDFEKILLLERIIHPKLLNNFNEKQKTKNKPSGIKPYQKPRRSIRRKR